MNIYNSYIHGLLVSLMDSWCLDSQDLSVSRLLRSCRFRIIGQKVPFPAQYLPITYLLFKISIYRKACDAALPFSSTISQSSNVARMLLTARHWLFFSADKMRGFFISQSSRTSLAILGFPCIRANSALIYIIISKIYIIAKLIWSIKMMQRLLKR